jgi:AcrR family transcriptional regulator
MVRTAVSIPLGKGGVEETRGRILAACRELYARKGSRGTTTREVAERAGFNEATLFRHFGTKQQLLSAMWDHYSGHSYLAEAIENVRALPLDEQLRALAAGSIETMTRKQDLIKVGMAEEFLNPEGSICAWRGPVEARATLTGFMRDQIARGELHGDPSTLARIFMSMMFAYVMARTLWSTSGEDLDADRAVVDMVHIFLNGARA